MAGITQTIASFNQGISEQPDHLKFQGQVRDVVNAVPDLTYGLFKRPGAARVGTAPLASVANGGSWFHYFRDENEGAYLGQVDSSGVLKVWKASGDNPSAAQTVIYGARAWFDTDWYYGDKVQNNARIYEAQASISQGTAAPTHTSGTTNNWKHIETVATATTRINNYLTTSDPENLQFLTINDTTFVTNRDSTNSNTKVGETGSTADRPEAHCAMIELLRTENGRQYGLNIFDSTATNNFPNNLTTVKRATKIKIIDHDFDEEDNSGHCPGIGTEVFSCTAKNSYTAAENITHIKNGNTTLTSGRDNLIFRTVALGQQGISPDYAWNSDSPDGNNYRCSYNLEVTLLHGGEGWEVGDTVRITPEHAKQAANVNYTGSGNNGSQAYMDVQVTEIETTTVKASLTVNSNVVSGLVRPSPTPFDADTAVTSDTILAGIIADLPTGISARVIGPGIYLSSANPFNVEIVEEDLMRVFQKSVNEVTLLPNMCRHGYIVKVANARMSDEDDYYLRFIGENNLDGSGSWEECAKPNITDELTNMPLVIQRTGLLNAGTSSEIATFTIREFYYAKRRVGDTGTNPMPTFLGKRINKVLFYRNRLAILAGENVILSRPGSLAEPDFFAETALTVSASDPIDISAASTFPSEIFDAIEINAGLLVFSTNQQFLLATDDTILNPDTAKLRSVATFNYNKDVPPISLGTTIAYIDNSGKYSRMNEMANTAREGEPLVVEITKLVPSLLPKNIDLLTNSRENSLVLLAKSGVDSLDDSNCVVYGYKYFVVGDRKQQAAWFKWKLNNPLKYHFIVNDEYYFIDTDNFLQTIKLVQSEDEPSINQDNINYLIHLDNHTDISGGVYNATTQKTTFSSVSWMPQVNTPIYELALIDIDTSAPRLARYAKPTTASTTSFTVPGNWSREVTAITVTNGGSGYTSAPTVTISGGSGSAADATATIVNGAVTEVNINNNGYNYTSAPTVTFTGGGGSSAAATAAIHSGAYKIGYLYEYLVEFPRIYPTKVSGEKSFSDVNSSLIIHRCKFHFGKVGLYETKLKRLGKSDYDDVYESNQLDEYEVSDAPYLEEHIQTIPVYEKNKNVDIFLKSSHPAPATLRAMAWEGDYSTMFYKRA